MTDSEIDRVIEDAMCTNQNVKREDENGKVVNNSVSGPKRREECNTESSQLELVINHMGSGTEIHSNKEIHPEIKSPN